MLNRSIFTILMLLLAALMFLGNSNGRATVANVGNTGAPGDATQANGTPITCAGCHNAGQFSTTLSIQLRDGQGQVVSEYTPEENYTVRVMLGHSGAPAGFGFQMVALRNSDNTNIGTFSDIGSNNYKLKTIASSGRNYAEHDGVSSSNTFNVTWKAPAAGAGEVTFYAAGCAVNMNGNSGGDGAAAAKLTVTEKLSVAAPAPAAEKMHFRVLPNPLTSRVVLAADGVEAGEYQLTVCDVTGRVVTEQYQFLHAGHQTFTLDCEYWQSGIYFITIRGKGGVSGMKAIKK